MKKLLSSIMAVAALAGIQAFAQEEDSPSLLAQLKENTKCSLIPTSIKLSLDYKSRYLSDGRVINPQNMLYTEEDIRKLQALQRQALIAEAQQAIEFTNYNLKQVEILLAQK